MSFLGMWVVVPLPDPVVAELAPVLRPVIAERQNLPETRGLWEQWVQAPELVRGLRPRRRSDEAVSEAASEAFMELSDACPLDEHVELLYDAMNRSPKEWHDLVVCAGCRKGYPAAALAHGLGPARFAMLPGWFGDFVLTADEVRATLPAVTTALALDPEERRAAGERTAEWLCETGDGDPREADVMLDGLVPLWRGAVERGAGLLGCMIIPS
ncbi:hypothetical protein E6W39_38365 [Kitasatospora acidiphila]|uniref:Uncharacterized protein n=1 Tax=Kitasatospora acidiphila TaxID=2567942 RepID=A0A540WEZ5_9ACTN|nr:hypothetical protein [Kitasatospora acidiphila]TQF06984.1 hypothetical protein E6W39_38365 [Kitasatospora acidiphila]